MVDEMEVGMEMESVDALIFYFSPDQGPDRG